jgi:hypothetical protein
MKGSRTYPGRYYSGLWEEGLSKTERTTVRIAVLPAEM